MSAREPLEMAQVAAETGAKKVHRTWDRVLVSAFLAGAYISFGALVAITVSSGLDPAAWGTLPTLFMGAAFTLGLVLVLIAGSDLATGNMMLAGAGNLVGAVVFVATSYWYLFLKDQPDRVTAPAQEPAERA
jgi:formate/nitrite transporter FocA (FNT family)